MVAKNPLRLELYEKYKRLLKEYKNGKDITAVEEAFCVKSDKIYVSKLSVRNPFLFRRKNQCLNPFDLPAAQQAGLLNPCSTTHFWFI